MKLHVATPCHHGFAYVNYVNSMLNLQTCLIGCGVDFHWDIASTESSITRNRNELVARFLEGDATDFMFIDADIGFMDEDVFRLLGAPYDVACGVYRKKDDSAGFAADTWNVGEIGPDGFAKIRYAPTGFMRIKRRVFDKLKEGFGLYRGTRGWTRAYFENTIDPDTREYLTEDYGFCRLCGAADIPVYVDLNSKLEHMGSKRYTGVFREVVEAERAKQVD